MTTSTYRRQLPPGLANLPQFQGNYNYYSQLLAMIQAGGFDQASHLGIVQNVLNSPNREWAARQRAKLEADAQLVAQSMGEGAPPPEGGDTPSTGSGQALLRLPADPSRRGGGVGRMMGPPMDEPTKPLVVGAPFEGIRGDQTYPATITSIQRGPDGAVTGALVSYTDANGQQVEGKRISVDGLRLAGFDLGGFAPQVDSGAQGAIVPTVQPQPVPQPEGRKGPWGLFGDEVVPSLRTLSPPGTGGPGSLESDRAIELRDILAQTGGNTGGMGGIGGGGSLPYNTGGVGGDSAIPGGGSTDLFEQQTPAQIIRNMVLGAGVPSAFQGLEQARLGRNWLPFLVGELTAPGEVDPQRAESPSAFRDYINSVGGGGDLSLGNTLAQAGSFLGQDLSGDPTRALGQGELRRVLQNTGDPNSPNVGTALLGPIIDIVGQSLGRNFGIDLGRGMQEALANDLARNPSAYASAEQYIQALQQQGILDWLNRRF